MATEFKRRLILHYDQFKIVILQRQRMFFRLVAW